MATKFIDVGLTVEQVRSRLLYNPKTGKFRWRRGIDHWRAGLPAGTEIEMGRSGHKRRYVLIGIGNRKPTRRYTLIGINHRNYRAHRLAWAYVYGEWPDQEIDHINGNGCDNRIANLRLATHAQNCQNQRKPKHNTSGLKGAYFDRRLGKWLAQIRCNGTQHYLGYFDTAKEAHDAYVEAAKRLHGSFARTK